jgi:hypothetical protein
LQELNGRYHTPAYNLVMNKQIDESVLQKIRKLLALAQNNKNANERDVAMQFAMDMLAKHNLSMAQIMQAGAIGDDNGAVKVGEYESDIRLERWTKDICSAVCKLYYCDYYMTGALSENYALRTVPVFIGTRENISVAIEVANYLIRSVRSESNMAFKDAALRRSFRQGAARRIYERACQMIAAEKSQGTSTGTSLIVVRNGLEKANQSYLKKLKLKYTTPRVSYIDGNAYNQGQEFGDSVGLDRTKRPAGHIQG